MARKYSSEYKALQPYVVEDIRKVVTAAGTVGGSASTGVTDHGALTGLSDDDHPQYLTPVRGDARYIPSTRTLTAGAGLTGGGDLSADRSFAVGAGLGITVNADDVALASSVAGDGLTYSSGVLAVGVSGLGLGVGADAVTLTSSSNPGAAAAILASSAAGLLTLQNGAFTQAASSAATFASGFAGSGWRADYGITTAGKASLEVDDLTVRGRMRVYELLIQQIRATNGSLFVSSASKVVEIAATTGNPLWTVNGSQLKFNGSNATLTTTIYTINTVKSTGATDTDGVSTDRRAYHGFLYGDVIRAQQVRWNGSSFAGIIQSNLEVTAVPNLYSYNGTLVSGDAAAVGYDYVRLGNAWDSSRQGSVYLTSDDSAAPFIDIVDGVRYHTDWNSASVARVRVGKLTGISDSDFGGALSGYGLYGTNVYLKGSIYASSGSFTGTVYANAGSFTGTVTAALGSIGGWTLSASSLIAGSGANTVGLDSGGTNPAIYAGSATPGSAPFRVTKTGDLTATNATVAGDFSVASSTFGSTGVQMQYNGGSPRFYVGDGSNAYIKYESTTGYPIVSGIYIQGASYVTGSVYAGNSAVRLSTDGQRLVLPNLPSIDVKTDIPTSSSAIRWFAGITDTWTSAANYTGQISYRSTGSTKAVDWAAMSYVGSTDYATYYARSMLYANRYNGSTNKTCRVEAAVDPGAGGAYVTLDCDTAYTTAAMYVATNMSALSITDRTPHYDGDALAELRQVRGKTRTVKGKPTREIDHDTLPAFARVRVVDAKTKEARDERDLGAMISMLTVAVQQLDARLDALEGRGNGRQ